MIDVALVFVGGAAGASARFLTDRAVQARHHTGLPLGTMLVNVVGCLVLGLIAGAAARHGWSPRIALVVGTGFCGGLTTFSAFSVEAVELADRGERVRAMAYVVLSVALGLGLAAGGYLATSGA